VSVSTTSDLCPVEKPQVKVRQSVQDIPKASMMKHSRMGEKQEGPT
jgi:hypothetical protein